MKKAEPDPVEIVKRQLWRNGVRAKDVSGTGLGFDLLADGNRRVKVVLDTRGNKRSVDVPAGMIVALVRESGIVYLDCEGNVCREKLLTKIFNV